MDLFYAIGPFHGLMVVGTALIIIYTDHQGYLYFRGKKATLSASFITWSHRLVWAGLAIIITTGAALMIPAWEYYSTLGIFYVKMGFVALLILNGLAIGTLSKKASTTPFAELTQKEQRLLMLSGGLSFIGWVSAAVIGYFIL